MLDLLFLQFFVVFISNTMFTQLRKLASNVQSDSAAIHEEMVKPSSEKTNAASLTLSQLQQQMNSLKVGEHCHHTFCLCSIEHQCS